MSSEIGGIEGFSGILLVSENPERLARFYRDVLGIPLEEERHDETLPHWGATLSDVHFAIHPIEDFPDRKSGVGAVKLAFTVFDVRAFARRLEDRGISLLYPPRDEGFFVGTALLDPDGNFVELTELVDAWFEGMEERRGRAESALETWRTRKAVPLGSAAPARKIEPRVLEGRRVRLQPLDPDADVADLYAGSHGDPETESLWTYMGYGPFASKEAMRDWLRACASSEDPLFLAVVDKKSGARIGMVSFLAIREAMRVLELGHIWYVPGAQGTGANTDAVYTMLRESFERLGYRRVEWKCDRENRRSRRAALRLGFTFEGIFRQHMIVKGRNRDTAWFSLLDHEWPEAKKRLEAAL
jgi:RimJ/RimL family protein N-acetyltransferase/predicted enzyme related to lactoylglutathione lyase